MEFEINGDLYLRLARLTNGSPFLLYATLMSVLKICLHKYTGSGTIVVGSPAMFDPKQATIEANAVAIVDAVDEQQSFRELLLQVRNNLLEAYARQSYPFEILVEDLALGHAENRCPLFDCALALESIHGDLPVLRNDVTLTFSERPGRLGGLIESNRSLFGGETIERFTGHLTNILRQVLDNTGVQIRQLQILTDAERHHLTVALNDTRVDYPKGKCIHQLIEAQVARTPDAVAVVFEDERLNYRELNARANQLAHHLRALGVGADVKVGLLIEHSIEMVIGLLGILKAGGAYLPLDPSYPRERLSFMLADSQVRVLLTQQKLLASFPEHLAQVICLDADCELLTRESEENLSELANPANLAYVIYTSGSTGKPKGVMITHQGLVNYLTWGAGAYGLADGQGAATHSSIGFDLTITSLFSPLLAGKRVELVSAQYGIDALVNLLKTGRDFSLLKLTPSHLAVLSKQLNPQDAGGATRALIVGGEMLSSEMLGFWQTHAPGTRIINEYGPTETVVGCCVYEVERGRLITGGVPIGRPIANTQLYILDRQGQPVPAGVSGELYIGGDGLARGYSNKPALTAERFIPDPFSGTVGGRLYQTGDLTRYLPDGNIEFVGRNDLQVKLRGFRIELGEIETALVQHGAVREAVVVALADERQGESQGSSTRLVAYLVAEAEQAFAIADLRAFLSEQLPDYMIPAHFMVLDQMPLTANGKVDRQALPVADTTRGDSAAYVAPRRPAEELVAGMWSEILRVPRIGVHDNFFELGGHSLLATQVVSRVREVFGIELPLRGLFESPTVAGLAETIEGARLNGSQPVMPPLRRAERSAPLPLSFAQQRLWFLDQLEPGNAGLQHSGGSAADWGTGPGGAGAHHAGSGAAARGVAHALCAQRDGAGASDCGRSGAGLGDDGSECAGGGRAGASRAAADR